MMMTSSTILPPTSSSNLLEREYLIRTKRSSAKTTRIIALQIFDDLNHTSEEILLTNSQNSDSKKNIDVFHIQIKEKLTGTIRRLKLHTKDQLTENRIFLHWIELTDLKTKHTFCFPVEDYLPSSAGDTLELTEGHQDTICEGNDERISGKAYDVRTKTGPKGFLGIQSTVNANVYLRLFDTNDQSSETILLDNSRLHKQPFRSNQTDQFEIATTNNLGTLKKVEFWHDGKKNTRFYCDTLEITDQSNGQIYCFEIKEHLENDQKFILTDYSNRRCLKTHDDTRLSLTPAVPFQEDPPTTNSSDTNLKQTLYKIRTRVGHKGFLSLGMGGTDARVSLRVHQGPTVTNDILLHNSLTHHNPFEAGHTDVFEIHLPESFISPDQLEIFHTGKKHDGLYLKWIEIMNMNTLERKCFPINRWLDSNEGDEKTRLILTDYTLNESCEENEYHQHHSNDGYQTEYLIRTKTNPLQPVNPTDTHANIYLKIFNDKKKHTEDLLLTDSKHHNHPFQAGKIDKFEVRSMELMDDHIDKLELWHDNKSQFNWFCQWIEIKNKKTGSIKCFAVNRLLSGTSFDGATKLVLTIHSNHSCDHIEDELHNLITNIPMENRLSILEESREDYIKKYVIQIQTGKKMLSKTNANVYIRLYDEFNQQSEDLLLEQSVTKKIPFDKYALDEFHTGTWKNLSDLKKIQLWYTGEKQQGWIVEYVQIEDLNTRRIYCFPVKKSLDFDSTDRITRIELTEFTVDQPCAAKELQKAPVYDDQKTVSQLKRSYHVETKTGKRGFLGLSPTGTNAKVYIRIHDRNRNVSERIELDKSTNHRNKFERGQTDRFDVGSVQSLDGIDKLEVWHDDTGSGHGWFADYISVIDNQTGEESCFFIGQYLNNDNGGIEGKHLILDKQSTDNRPCREHQSEIKESTVNEPLTRTNAQPSYKQTYEIETKTGHTGLFGLGAAGTDAPVFIRIHDNNGETTESIHLTHSLRHRNKFEKNQTDLFDVGTNQSLDGVRKLELWHEGGRNDGWQVDYVNVIDKKTGHSYCFLVNAMLDRDSGLRKTHILLENPSVNTPCSEQFTIMKQAHTTSLVAPTNTDKIQRHFSIKTKTGNQIEAGSTTAIYIQLFDDREQNSENIRLKHKDHDKHNFIPNAIDEFELTSSEPLSDQLIGIRVKHHAEKYQGWYAEWIEVTDQDNQQTFCFPIQRWIDKGENDKKTDVYFTTISDVPCQSLPETMPNMIRRSIPTVRGRTGTMDRPSSISSRSPASSTAQIQSTYHVKTKTGKKGFLGLSPTGTNAKVFLRIIDNNGDISERLQLHGSIDHKNKFERGQTDEFDIGSNQALTGIDQIELWTDAKNLASGWFPQYIEVTDNKTGEMACFPINQYLNEKNGGIQGNPLRLKKRLNSRPCAQLADEQSVEDSRSSDPEIMNKYQSTFSVITKTGHRGFLGLAGAGTNAPVFIRIHDTKGKISEAIQLKHSTRHKNKFERDRTDQFDIGTVESLVGISRIELWHEGDQNDGWQVEYIQIYDNQTNTSYCFPLHSMLDENSGLKQTHVLLEKPLINISCPEQTEILKRERMNTDASQSKKKKDKHQRNFIIRTKTGNQIESRLTTPIHLQLFDDQNESSEDIRLKHQEHGKQNFKPGAIDEFQVTSHQPLSNQLKGIRVKHNAEKYQGWYAEWIEITDEDNERSYCYPIQRWIDKGENDKKTDLFFTDTSAVPCDSLPDTSVELGRKTRDIASHTSTSTPPISYQNTYHVETKTGKKGIFGLSPTGTNANVYIRIIDRDGNKSEPISLKGSIDHKNKFQRNRTDEFDVGSTKSLNGIKQLEVWTDGKGFGHGWYADYIAVTDNKTNEEACFLIDQYLNKEYGGVDENHLLLDKQFDDIPCREKIHYQEDDKDTVQTQQIMAVRSDQIDSTAAIPYKRTYHVDTKTGQKGFWNRPSTSANADVYLRIYDEVGHVSEPISLHRSTKHSSPFAKGNIDSFDIGTREALDNIFKLELYHNDTGFGHGWNVEYINILDNLAGHSYCFPVDQSINQGEHIILDNYTLDANCEEINNQRIESKSDAKDRGKRRFTVRTKTGSQIEAASTTPIYLRLYDDYSQKSEKIRLKQKTKEGHHFQPGSIDEFPIISNKSLTSIIAIELSHTADKYQGWYGEWITLTDHDRHETVCFPLQRWLDKGELDGKTEIYLKRVQDTIPCEDLPDTMQRQSLSYRTANEKEKNKSNMKDYPSKYHVQVKTAKKGLLGLAPTGTDANVFLKIHDRDGKISEAIELMDSLNHKNKFTRGNLDEFDVGSTEDLNGIGQLELWTDGKGFGNGWCPEYLRITDKNTGEVSCFAVEQYLNEKYGGSKDEHLMLNKQPDNRICDELKGETPRNSVDQTKQEQPSPFNSDSRERFQIEIKTGHTGFLGLGGAGTDAPVFIQFYDSTGQKSEIFQLKHSIRHKNKFERNQTDQFLVHTDEPLKDISKVDLWHEGTRNDGWQVDYVNIFDKKSKTSYCFPVNAMLDRNSGLKQTIVHLENPSINAFCKEQSQAMRKTPSHTSISKRHKSNGNYTIQIQTGDHPSAGSTTPIHVQLIDMNEKKSKEIHLKKKDLEGHHFAPGAIDEFQIIISESLSTLKAVKLSVDAEKYQGWYGEWISITDNDNQMNYCFPIQRWLDKGEDDRKTHVILYQQSTIPCREIPKSTMINSNQDNPKKFSLEIRMQTAEKSLKSQSGQEVNMYLNIYDGNHQSLIEPIGLINSTYHQIPFQRHQIDQFDFILPIISFADIDHIELSHNGQNDGWFCDWIELKNIQTNERKCFIIHQSQSSITNYRLISCDYPNTNLNSSYYYLVRIKTNTTNLPSNDAMKISLKLFGKVHQTDWISLDNPSAFQQNNSIDTFEIRTLQKLNSLEKLELSYRIFSSDIQISFQWIEITNLSNGNVSCFAINRSLIQSDREQIYSLTVSTSKKCS